MTKNTCSEIKKHTRRGRPKLGGQAQVSGYQIQYTLSRDEDKIALYRAKKGRFILSTNQLCQKALPNDWVLREYKAQSGTEKSFKFIQR